MVDAVVSLVTDERHAKNLHRYGQMSVPLWILNGNQQSTRLHIQLGEEPRAASVSLLICISNHRAAPSPPPSLCDLPCYRAGNLILNFVNRNPVTHKMLHSSKKENNSLMRDCSGLCGLEGDRVGRRAKAESCIFQPFWVIAIIYDSTKMLKLASEMSNRIMGMEKSETEVSYNQSHRSCFYTASVTYFLIQSAFVAK
ncbi:hypothetical protein E5288_WYG014182 [Bos mutus]|uniref:Uncharacterized protein n=1 Tax=Bos mutus TaxID=72004 RepID=A0A6B0R326_9CETA|nr:hypothetical protein [Bos mutus]